MASTVRKIFKRFFIGLNLVVCVLFLIACLSPVMSPEDWWPIGFFSLAVPYFIIIIIFSIIFWLIVKPILVLIPVITLLIGIKQIIVLFAWHPTADFMDKKAYNSLRIVDWNVSSMYGLSNNADKRKHNRTEIADAIIKYDPGVICLQEFNHSYSGKESSNNIGLFSAKYPYYFFSRDYTNRSKNYASGCIIFSKYPIIDSGKINYPKHIAESIIYADILKDGDTVRIYTTHLQSYKFTPVDYDDMEKIKDPGNETLEASKNIIQKMKAAFERRSVQSETLSRFASQSTHPSIICGDFNDVPNSFTYFKSRGNRQDAFLKQGFGIGSSYLSLAPALRIDYIFPDNTFQVMQFDMDDQGLSDHSMLIADMQLKK
ncbi:MAG: endonuclease/exonuclease/phosphatase family protein [Bacteroidetes bacterium]|nr:endonuclease/exonuclease/phosphatase family protein [Bacteroidota bacterium]